MPSQMPKFTLRTDRTVLEKIRYIADDNFRTVNKEIEMLLIRYIADYEAQHGEIRVPQPEDDD